MAAKLPVLGFLVVCVVAASRVIASEEPTVVAGVRDQIIASIGPGYAHVAKVERPIRRVTGQALGSPNLIKPTTIISVIGTLTDQQVRTILGLVGDGVMETTKVTGDQEFAVVQLGDPQRDPCCTTTVLFENRVGIWTNLGAITQSH